MSTCEKCGSPLNQHLICTRCGIDHSSFLRHTAFAMKMLGLVCATIGVAMIVFGDQLKTDTHPYDLWLFAGAFVVVGFVMFMREWKA
jgi:drug/metabolite transporter (DMT)-like permease